MSQYDANLLTKIVPQLSSLRPAAASNNPKAAANWMLGDLSAALNKEGLAIGGCKVTPEGLGSLISRIDDGTLSSKMAKTVFEGLWAGEPDVDRIIEDRGLKQVSDSGHWKPSWTSSSLIIRTS